MDRSITPQNLIRDALDTGVFLHTLEYVPDPIDGSGHKGLDHLTRNAELVGRNSRVRGVNIGDRVRHMSSHSTVECGKLALKASGKMPLLHLAGKDRTPGEAIGVLLRALDSGLSNFLLISGDRVAEPTRPGRVRYHDSVLAILDAKRLAPNCTVAAAVSPFKYREEELLNQYLKMAKKIGAGADYLITNCGWDMAKYQELLWYRDARGFGIPIVANLLLPSLGWAKGIHSGRLPGVHMTDSLFAKIQEESKLGKLAKELYFRRLALQIVGVKLMGYAGVQLSGVETYEALCHVIELADDLAGSLRSLEAWRHAWDDAHTLSDGSKVDFSPRNGLYLFKEAPKAGSLKAPPVLNEAVASDAELRKYKWLAATHRLLFEKHSVGAAVLGPVCRAIDATEIGRQTLLKLEQMIKQPVLGCDTCGFCRIPHLSYVCPETCPKGLANGPCSGTVDNVCEFKDRECIHNSKYRIAKATGRLSDLEEVMIPAVSDTRMTSSWVNEYNGTIPSITRIPAQRIERSEGD